MFDINKPCRTRDGRTAERLHRPDDFRNSVRHYAGVVGDAEVTVEYPAQ